MVDEGPSWCPGTARVEILWEDWWVAHLLWPLAVQLSLTVVFKVLVRPLYVRTYYRSRRFKTLIQTHIGTTQHKKVLRPKLLLSLRAAQIFSSFVSVTVWVSRTYAHGCTLPDRAALLLASLVDLLNWAANRLRAEGAAYSLWEANGVVDALTLVPALRCGLLPDVCGGGADWLTLHFLRSMVLSFNFQRIQETGWMQRIPRRILFIVQLALRVLSLIFVMAGTIFTCELLGDPAFLADSYIQTAHGDEVSVAQMLYWIVISLTTVGYGDFAPKALISRMLTAVFIIYGIANVFLIQFSFTQLWSRYREGSGCYRPWRRKTPHIVVILGIRGSASKLSSVLAGFLLELLHPAHNGQMAGEGDWPNVVLVSPSLWEEERGGGGEDSQTATFEDFLLALDLPTEARGRVWFLVGSATDPETLHRADVGSSVLTFILTDMKSLTPDEDDGQNIYTAMIVRKFYPSAQLRVMLVRPESRNLAVQAGVEATSCFSARELTAHILAQNVRCHGLLPMITGLFKSWDLEDVEHFLDHVFQNGDGLPVERASLSQTSLCSDRSIADSYELSAPTSPTGSAPVAPRGSRRRVDRAESVLLAVRASMPRRLNAPPGERSSILGFAADIFRAGSARLSSQPRTSQARSSLATPNESITPSIASDNSVTDFWMFQYFHGLSQGVYGFALAEEYDGEWFGKVAYDIFKSTGAILLGVFYSDRVQICPQNLDRPLRAGQICFAVARSSSALDPCRLQTAGSDWRKNLMESRAQVQNNHVRHGTHVAAMKLMGHQLRRRMTVSYSAGASPSHFVQAQRKMEAQGGEGSQTPGGGESLRGGMASRSSMAPSEEVERAEAKDIHRALDIRRGLSEHDELTVVVVCNGEVWQQVRTFVQSLRAPFQPTARQTERPVIVLAPTAPPAGLVEELGDRIGCLRGSSLSAEDLVDAGVLEARAVVVMSGANPSRGTFREPLFRDCRVVLCSQEIECWCGFSRHEVFAAYELQDSRSARHLPAPSRGCRKSLQEVLNQAEHIFDDVEIEATRRTRGTLSNGSLGTRRATERSAEKGSAKEEGEVADEAVKDSILFNSRFAAGQVFSPELFGTMLGRMFYMPAIIELVEALLMPHVRRQKAFMWQMRVPSHYVGKEFGELFRDLSLGELGAREARSPGGHADEAGARRGERRERSADFAEVMRQASEPSDLGRASGHDTRASGHGSDDASEITALPGRSSDPRRRSSGQEEAPVSPMRPALARQRSSARFARTLTWRSSTFSAVSQGSVVQVHEPAVPAPPEQPGCIAEERPSVGEKSVGTMPILRSRQSAVSVFSAFGNLSSYNSLFDLTTGDHLQAVGPAVPIALYRLQDPAADKRLSPGTGGHNFSFLAPDPQQKLTGQDWVTVLGSRAFGTKVDEMGLLRGSTHGPAQDLS